MCRHLLSHAHISAKGICLRQVRSFFVRQKGTPTRFKFVCTILYKHTPWCLKFDAILVLLSCAHCLDSDGENEWSQWVLRFKAKGIHTQEYHDILHPDVAPLSTTVRNMVMSKLGGCRKWPFHGQPNRRTGLPHVNFPECESLHTLVHPL